LGECFIQGPECDDQAPLQRPGEKPDKARVANRKSMMVIIELEKWLIEEQLDALIA
jgi:hypothetical protein